VGHTNGPAALHVVHLSAGRARTNPPLSPRAGSRSITSPGSSDSAQGSSAPQHRGPAEGTKYLNPFTTRGDTAANGSAGGSSRRPKRPPSAGVVTTNESAKKPSPPASRSEASAD
jgi:hypothetical protein